jgi:hypothetical protein
LGVGKEGSPLYRMADLLFDAIAEDAEELSNYVTKYKQHTGELQEFVKKEFSQEVLQRVQDARSLGKNILYGKLRSDGEGVESFFCMESFELESDAMYFNALECAW